MINKQDVMFAAKNCKARSGLTDDFEHQIRKELCECLSKAFNVDVSEMQCDQASGFEIEEDIIVVFAE